MKLGTILAHMMNYRQLSYEQRIEIYAYLKAGLNQSKIAELTEISKSTISREVKRNTGLKGYRPQQARFITRKIVAIQLSLVMLFWL